MRRLLGDGDTTWLRREYQEETELLCAQLNASAWGPSKCGEHQFSLHDSRWVVEEGTTAAGNVMVKIVYPPRRKLSCGCSSRRMTVIQRVDWFHARDVLLGALESVLL